MLTTAPTEVPDPATQWRALAPVIAGQPRVRESRDGGRNYPARWERALQDELPRVPAAVRLYGPDGTLRCLAADFDVSRGGQVRVDQDVVALTQLIADCGGDVIADQSPNGGRHLYLPLQDSVAFPEVQRVARALAARFPSLDPTPLLNLLGGCIRPPGRGTRPAATSCLPAPSTPRSPWLGHPTRAPSGTSSSTRSPRSPRPAPPTSDAAEEYPSDDLRAEGESTHRWASLPAALAAIARTGQHAYRSDSEARQAVLTSAAARGWPLLEIARRVELGTWAGLASFYARYPARHRRQALLRDWRKAMLPSPPRVPLSLKATQATQPHRRHQERPPANDQMNTCSCGNGGQP